MIIIIIRLMKITFFYEDEFGNLKTAITKLDWTISTNKYFGCNCNSKKT